MNQSVPEHVDRGLALLQHNVPYERFVRVIFWFHVSKNDLAKDGAKPLELNQDWPANSALEQTVIGSLHINSPVLPEFSKAFAPCGWKHQVRSTGIYKCVAFDSLFDI
jgi:hypothetical protein